MLAGRRGRRWPGHRAALRGAEERQRVLPPDRRRVDRRARRGEPVQRRGRDPAHPRRRAARRRRARRQGRARAAPAHAASSRRCRCRARTGRWATTSWPAPSWSRSPARTGKRRPRRHPAHGGGGRPTSSTARRRSSLAAEEVRVKARVALAGTGLTTHVGGPGGLVADFSAAFAGIDGVLLLVALAVVLVILLVVYRSPILPIAVLLSAVFGLSLAALVIRPLAENGTIELSGQSQGIMFILVVGAATDYALLLVSRFREELHGEPSTWVALRRAWRGAVEPIVASGRDRHPRAAVPAARVDLRNTAGLGPVGAHRHRRRPARLPDVPAGRAARLRAQGLLAVRSPRRRRARRGRRRHPFAVGPRRPGSSSRHPRRTWVLTLAVLLAAAAFAPTFSRRGRDHQGHLPHRHRLGGRAGGHRATLRGRRRAARSRSSCPPSAPRPCATAHRRRPRHRGRLRRAHPADPRAGRAAGPAPVDGLQLVQGTATGAADSAEAEETVRRLRASLDDVSPDALVGGQAAINLDVLEASGRDLRVIVPAILVVIFLVLCLLLRSVRRPAAARRRQRRLVRGDDRGGGARLRPRARLRRAATPRSRSTASSSSSRWGSTTRSSS